MTFRCRSWLLLLTLAASLAVCLGGDSSHGLAGRKDIDLPEKNTNDEQTCSQEGTCEERKGEDDDSCADKHEKCEKWSSRGECDANPKYMLKFCPKSCGICSNLGVNATEEIDIGETQRIDAKRADEVKARISAAQDYLANVVAKDPELRPLLENCKLEHEDCAFWSVIGECEANPSYMKLHCAPVCQTCDQLLYENRCPMDPETMERQNVWKPGDVNEYFTNLTTLEKFQKYSPRVMARPDYLPGDTEETADYMVNAPWVVVLENFISQEEAERLIEMGKEEGYERSSDVGNLKYDGSHEHNINDGRTSYNSWCSGVCYNDTVVKGVIERITDLTNIPEENSEWLQMLKYEVGQEYRAHHDLIEHQVDRMDGVRIMTVYLYLNDLDEESGGGTRFTNLDLTVQPKRGRVVLWPSVLDSDPHMKDRRTMHQALPVIKGVKYGANAWLHQRDFKGAHKLGCA